MQCVVLFSGEHSNHWELSDRTGLVGAADSTLGTRDPERSRHGASGRIFWETETSQFMLIPESVLQY